jgi:hypothetical protein
MGFLQSFLHLTNFRSPLLRVVVPTAAAIVGIQATVALPSIAYRTERFYDASGAATFVVASLISLGLPGLRAAASPNWRQLALTSTVVVWAATRKSTYLFTPCSALSSPSFFTLTRLLVGSYLFERVLVTGKDSRFDKIKADPSKFAVAWVGQVLWIVLCLCPVMAVNAIPPRVLSSTGVRPLEMAGLAAAVVGYGIEMTANWQRRRWLTGKMKKEHDQSFMTSGLFSVWCVPPGLTPSPTCAKRLTPYCQPISQLHRRHSLLGWYRDDGPGLPLAIGCSHLTWSLGRCTWPDCRNRAVLSEPGLCVHASYQGFGHSAQREEV